MATSTYSLFSVTNDEPWLPLEFGIGPRICFVLKSRRSMRAIRLLALSLTKSQRPSYLPSLLRQAGMVHVAPREVAHHLLRLLVEAVAGGRIRREDGNRGDVAHGRQAGDVDLAGVAAGVEQVELVLLARRDEGLRGERTCHWQRRYGLRAGCSRRWPARRQRGWRRREAGSVSTSQHPFNAVSRRSARRACRPGSGRGTSTGTRSAQAWWAR